MRLIHQHSEHWVVSESRVARVALCGLLCAGGAYTPPLFVSAEALRACWDAARQPLTRILAETLEKY
jgi:hypothetical protein